MQFAIQTIEREIKVMAEDHEHPEWGKPFVHPDSGIVYPNRALINFLPDRFMIRQFTLFCDYDEAGEVFFGIKSPGKQNLYKGEGAKTGKTEEAFLVGPHRLAYGGFEHEFSSAYSLSMFDLVFKSYAQSSVVVQFLAEIEFMKNG